MPVGAIALIAVMLGAPTSAAVPDLQTATPIKHLVVIFDENNSFDHYFGTYPKAAQSAGRARIQSRGRTRRLSTASRRRCWRSNPNSAAPFRLDRSQAAPATTTTITRDEQKAYDGGSARQVPGASAQGNGLPARPGMGYYDGNTVTALWNYAQHFAMSDNFFAYRVRHHGHGPPEPDLGPDPRTSVPAITGKVVATAR